MKGKPFWIASLEEDEMNENARRINRILKGKLFPGVEAVIEIMRRRYSKYGKQGRGHKT